MADLVVCGAINWDTTCYVERLPSPGEEVMVTRLERVPGGTGANVAVAAARILVPGSVAMIGALGQDEIVRHQLSILSAEGVTVDTIKIFPGESGQAYILVDTHGQNVIATRLGANTLLSPADLYSSTIEHALRNCHGLAITDPPLDIARTIVDIASKHNISVFWDPGVLLERGGDAIYPILSRVDTFFLNEVEATTLFNSTDPDSCLLSLIDQGFHNLMVLKLGSRGAVLLDPSQRIITEFPPIPLDSLDMSIVDTVGCGDTLLGVFAAYRSIGIDITEALVLAGVAAGLNATRRETRGSPVRVTLEATLQRVRTIGYTSRSRQLSD